VREEDAVNNPEDQADLRDATAQNVQAGMLRPPKTSLWAEGNAPAKTHETRNWSLFFFFRIMRQAEMRETATRLRAVPEHGELPVNKDFMRDKGGSPASKAKLDLAFPGYLNGGLVRQARIEEGGYARNEPGTAPDPGQSPPKPAPKIAADAPAQAFRNWLNVLVRADGERLIADAHAFGEFLRAEPAQATQAASATSLSPEAIAAIAQDVALDFQNSDLRSALRMAREIRDMLACIRHDYAGLMAAIRNSFDAPQDGSPHGPLARMILYELLRQGAPLFVENGKDKVLPVLRSEAAEAARFDKPEPIDRTPISMVFSFEGLKALKIHEDTLASFPDAFKEGMAARAHRLGDTGRNAPEHWEGELGLPCVHGYFTGVSRLKGGPPLGERFWKDLRAEIRLFNDPTVSRGSELRAWIGLLFRLVGLEIVHIELGQDPYDVGKNGMVKHLPCRVEHFGFRDGLSQPFVDMGLGDTVPGGGTADRRGTWRPVAPGEVFLDQQDETSETHMLPINADLRKGSTYLVFRKLEQDVEGFRAFLEQQRPDDKRAQQKLAAQFVGRWPNGTSLVHSPHSERSAAGAETEAGLNDFRYAADDPQGRKCPLGAHVRRANPRDIGGRDDVRHHRILRRGIAYGGPLLAQDAPVDDEKRGILFVCANARIDLQFEVVQGDWLNRGEFLGQAGLGRCPLSGANDASARARFLEAGAAAPVTGLPNFVTVRGGDYFFAPGVTALEGIADGLTFEVPVEDLPYRGHSIDDVETPSLFSEERLKRYWRDDLGRGKIVRVQSVVPPTVGLQETIAFVGWYSQVKKVLSNNVTPDGKGVHFSVQPYCEAGRRITRGEDFLIGTDAAGSDSRDRLFQVLKDGWKTLQSQWGTKDSPPTVHDAAAERLQAALRRTAGTRRIDLVDDLAVQAAYGVLDRIYGIPGPAWLTELAGAVQFARQHVGDLPGDWIAALKGERPTDPSLKTMQVWSIFLVADLIGNSLDQQPLHALARQAGSEMLNHIDQTLAETSARLTEAAARGSTAGPRTLIEALLFNAQDIGTRMRNPTGPQSELSAHYLKIGAGWKDVYQKDVAIILLEILGSTLAVIPLTFGSVMTKLLELRIDLSLLLPRLKETGARHIVYEAERLNPNNPIRFRRCTAAVTDDERLSVIKPGDFVATVISKANMDRKIFWRPERFHLGKSDPMADDFDQFVDEEGTHPRDLANYLLFGVEGSNKFCWGRDLVAMPVLEACIHACGRLQGLRKVAGPRGEPNKLGPVIIGLPARFTRLLPKDARGT
jgi:deferrochelatase/peroxidase EfeB